MLGRTHAVSSLVVTFPVAISITNNLTICTFYHLAVSNIVLKIFTIGCLLFAGILGALFPDIDTASSLLGRHTRKLSSWIYHRFGHRTITHNLWILLVVYLLYLIVPLSFKMFWLFFVLGMTLHLLEDSFSKQGVLWFYPLEKWHKSSHNTFYKKGHYYNKWYFYKTGGYVDKIGIYVFGFIFLLEVVIAIV